MFRKATKKQSKLRLAIVGVTGAGKTYSALRIAKGMSNKIALLDTEHGTASKYSDKFEFDVQEISIPTINNYINSIKEAGNMGYEVLIIDSLSHAWDFLLEEIERIASKKYHGNTFRAWGEGTPLQKKLIDTILDSNCHIIATMRVKTEYVVEQNDKGKMAPRKVGLSPRQRDGLEYEFDMIMEGEYNHYFHITKDRTSKYQDQTIEKPDEKFGKELIEWLNIGESKNTNNKTKVIVNKIMRTYEDENKKLFIDENGNPFTQIIITTKDKNGNEQKIYGRENDYTKKWKEGDEISISIAKQNSKFLFSTI